MEIDWLGTIQIVAMLLSLASMFGLGYNWGRIAELKKSNSFLRHLIEQEEKRGFYYYQPYEKDDFKKDA